MPFPDDLLAYIAREGLNPQPIPPGDPLALNPQPIPPKVPGGLQGLNPQPIPPREYGAMHAREILRLHWQADKLGVEVAPVSSWEDDPCPVGKRPPVPPHLPPPPEGALGPGWSTEYLLGFAATVALGRDGSRFVADALKHASEALSRSMA